MAKHNANQFYLETQHNTTLTIWKVKDDVFRTYLVWNLQCKLRIQSDKKDSVLKLNKTPEIGNTISNFGRSISERSLSLMLCYCMQKKSQVVDAVWNLITLLDTSYRWVSTVQLGDFMKRSTGWDAPLWYNIVSLAQSIWNNIIS